MKMGKAKRVAKEKSNAAVENENAPMQIPQQEVMQSAMSRIGAMTIEIDIMRKLMDSLKSENDKLREQLKSKKSNGDKK